MKKILTTIILLSVMLCSCKIVSIESNSKALISSAKDHITEYIYSSKSGIIAEPEIIIESITPTGNNLYVITATASFINSENGSLSCYHVSLTAEETSENVFSFDDLEMSSIN